MINHDRLFKELIETFFIEFLKLFFPKVAAYIEPSSIEFLRDQVFTDVTEGDVHNADLVAKARFRDQDTWFLIHSEPQGRKQSHFPSRMFTYSHALPRSISCPYTPSPSFPTPPL